MAQAFLHGFKLLLMVEFFKFPLVFLLLLAAGCAATGPRQELQTARMAVAQAHHSGAPEWAPEEFQEARDLLRQGEDLVRRGEYGAAQNILPLAETRALEALAQARKLHAEAERRRQEEAASARAAAEAAARAEKSAREKVARRLPPPPPARPQPAPEPPPPPSPPASYQVGQDETLWTIAAHRQVYGDPLLWPLLYQANRDQIKDPRQIYPGQILTIPREATPRELQEAREKARQSEIFPVEELLESNGAGPAPEAHDINLPSRRLPS